MNLYTSNQCNTISLIGTYHNGQSKLLCYDNIITLDTTNNHEQSDCIKKLLVDDTVQINNLFFLRY